MGFFIHTILTAVICITKVTLQFATFSGISWPQQLRLLYRDSFILDSIIHSIHPADIWFVIWPPNKGSVRAFMHNSKQWDVYATGCDWSQYNL
jgi:hypothetical protein